MLYVMEAGRTDLCQLGRCQNAVIEKSDPQESITKARHLRIETQVPRTHIRLRYSTNPTTYLGTGR